MDITAADVRAALARKWPRLYIYEVAARVRKHPIVISEVLNERRPLDPALAKRLLRAIDGARQRLAVERAQKKA